MRQNHRAGEKLSVDYADQTVPVIDRTTGEIHEAQVGSHIRALQYMNGVPKLVVWDNLKSGVTKTHR